MDFPICFHFMPESQVFTIWRKYQISCILSLERHCLPLQSMSRLKKHGLLHELVTQGKNCPENETLS